MCGIAGIVGTLAPPGAVTKMIDRLRHRGPDDRGEWTGPEACLGHSRLSILDTSAAGHQPMVLDHLVLVYNGELYNFRELRRELDGPFRSDSDTEVLLHQLRRDGEQALSRLTGMFAFALWDSREHRLLLVRDRVGIKPLCYRLLPGGGLAFASEVGALETLGHLRLDRAALRDYFTTKCVPAPRTVYAGIHKLPPGHLLEWHDGKVRIVRWWTPSLASQVRDHTEAVEELDGLLERVIPEHTVSDVPLGVLLSGGVDSATTVAYLERPHTFTLGLDVAHRDESAAAERVARHFDTTHHHEVASKTDIETALDTCARVWDEPYGDSAAWSTWLVSQLARRHVTVALGGEGGDELFLGYQRHAKQLAMRSTVWSRLGAGLAPALSQGGHSLQRRAATGLERYARLSGPFTPEQCRVLLAPAFERAVDDPQWSFREHWRDDVDPRTAMQWLDVHTWLPNAMLLKVDRASMAHSLEARPPLVDHRLVEFALRLHPDLLLAPDGSGGKGLLKDTVRPRVPGGHLSRPKSGFNLPVRRWVRARPELLRGAMARLAEQGLVRDPRLRPTGSEQIWSLLVLDRWLTARNLAVPSG